MKITDKQKEILDKYNVEYESINIDDLLIALFGRMNDFLDEEDNPTKEYEELETIYYEIYNENIKDAK